MTPEEATNQAQFLARCAREHGASWPRQSMHRYAGEQLVKTAYSQYRVVDGRCIVVQRAERSRFASEGASAMREDEEHECLGLHLVGYLIRHDDPGGIRWTMHGSPRAESKAVFWRAGKSGSGHFVVTSRLAPSVLPAQPPPVTGAIAAAAAPAPAATKKSGPPPLPVRTPAPPKPPANPWSVATPTGGVTLPVSARVQPMRPPAPPRAQRAERPANAPPPPPPRCMKPGSRA